MSNQDTTALEGLKVVDLTRQMAGPYASLVLGDFGADVVSTATSAASAWTCATRRAWTWSSG
jgi:crotonobetainyl-CoA:carnitine CoA-transferase CaiB-like acyl-CoA transferase